MNGWHEDFSETTLEERIPEHYGEPWPQEDNN